MGTDFIKCRLITYQGRGRTHHISVHLLKGSGLYKHRRQRFFTVGISHLIIAWVGRISLSIKLPWQVVWG